MEYNDRKYILQMLYRVNPKKQGANSLIVS